MNDINKLFFELIRVSIGVGRCLSKTPTNEEWKVLYDMAKKQCLVGICFSGVQKLSSLEQVPEEMLYLTWMGMAAKIQQRNETRKAKGDSLLSELRNNGMEACILKGQSLVQYYGDFSNLRQSGDIDVWVKNKSVMELDAYVKGLGLKPHTTAAHVSYEDNDGVEIELHAVPAFMRNFWTNRKLVQWYRNFKGSTTEFNLVYMMVHMYHHVLFEGLGLRQVMDYYFVLRSSYDNNNHRDNVMSTLDTLGMMRFAKGIMWIMKEVFALEDRYLICEPNEMYGRLILKDVMAGGNFGHHNEKNKGLHGRTAVGRSLNGLKRNMKFFALGAWEILCSPLWSTWHWFWRKRYGLL